MLLDFTLEQVCRLSCIKRWGIIEMQRDQSVAEHSYNVAAIALMIVDKMAPDIDDALKSGILSWSLIHDLPELVTGDFPTPVKAFISENLAVMERKVFPKYYQKKTSLNPVAITIVKIADVIDAIQFAERFCIDVRKNDIIASMINELHVLARNPGVTHINEKLIEAINSVWKGERIDSKII